jgi:hypothetical protein
VQSDFLSIEIQEFDRKVPWPEDDYMLPASKRGPPPFDFERTVRFMSYGFIMAPIQHHWFAFLGKTFPVVAGKKTSNVLRMVAMDQFIFAPCSTYRTSFAMIFAIIMLTKYDHRLGILLHIHNSH